MVSTEQLLDRPRVGLLAETAAHARCVGKLLRGWAVMDAVPDDKGDKDDNGGQRHEPRATGAEHPPAAVATLVCAARHGVGCDVLIRATAGSGKLDWGQSIRSGDFTPGSMPALVLDIGDSSCPRGRSDSEARRVEYHDQQLIPLRPRR